MKEVNVADQMKQLIERVEFEKALNRVQSEQKWRTAGGLVAVGVIAAGVIAAAISSLSSGFASPVILHAVQVCALLAMLAAVLIPESSRLHRLRAMVGTLAFSGIVGVWAFHELVAVSYAQLVIPQNAVGWWALVSELRFEIGGGLLVFVGVVLAVMYDWLGGPAPLGILDE